VGAVAEPGCADEMEDVCVGDDGHGHVAMPDVGAKGGTVSVAVVVAVAVVGQYAYAEQVERQESLSSHVHLLH
jgi:hypothetical protein